MSCVRSPFLIPPPRLPQILYFVTVVITEMVVLYNEDQRMKQLQKQAKKGGAKKSPEEEANEKARRTKSHSDVEIGNVDLAANPMFVTASGGAAADAGSSSMLDALVRQSEPPSVAQWRVIQNTFLETQATLTSAKEQLAEAKRELQMGGGGGDSGRSSADSGPAKSLHVKKAFAATQVMDRPSALLLKGKSGLSLKKRSAVE